MRSNMETQKLLTDNTDVRNTTLAELRTMRIEIFVFPSPNQGIYHLQ